MEVAVAAVAEAHRVFLARVIIVSQVAAAARAGAVLVQVVAVAQEGVTMEALASAMDSSPLAIAGREGQDQPEAWVVVHRTVALITAVPGFHTAAAVAAVISAVVADLVLILPLAREEEEEEAAILTGLTRPLSDTTPETVMSR